MRFHNRPVSVPAVPDRYLAKLVAVDEVRRAFETIANA